MEAISSHELVASGSLKTDFIRFQTPQTLLGEKVQEDG
jgi:hypothetical protein